MASADIFHEPTVRELTETMPSDLMLSILETYEVEATSDLEKLRAALASDDGKTARERAHRIKSASLTFGAAGVAHLAAEAEDLARQGSHGDAAPLLDPIAVAIQRFVEALKARLTS
jgi:HPt (histidine-containing phosphotransfer) domain-containing protein